MTRKHSRLILLLLCLAGKSAFSQCAPGIPGVGNPGCVPPDVPGSPGRQHNYASSTPEPIWEARWGAIVYDKDTDRFSLSSGEKSKRIAVKKVIKNCKEKGGKKCDLVFAYYNQCAAIASNENNIGYGRGPYKSIAEELALKKCEKIEPCEIIYSKCNYAERVN
ncbi:DUF4189 domain-containing protein [Dyella sp.]|uniref:DUF4189 domain-containing protein n=1 Tax=Dyella sp. TaxID=1869338 RepID=UPI002ED31026